MGSMSSSAQRRIVSVGDWSGYLLVTKLKMSLRFSTFMRRARKKRCSGFSIW